MDKSHVMERVIQTNEQLMIAKSASKDFDELFTKQRPIIVAFHGFPLLIDRLTYRRTNHAPLYVGGYKGQGTTTTPFGMVLLAIFTDSI